MLKSNVKVNQFLRIFKRKYGELIGMLSKISKKYNNRPQLFKSKSFKAISLFTIFFVLIIFYAKTDNSPENEFTTQIMESSQDYLSFLVVGDWV